MRCVAGVVAAVLLVSLAGCGSSESGGSGYGGSSGSAGSTASGGSSGNGGGDARSDAPLPGQGCAQAGGMCDCAGSCGTGYHPAEAPLLYDCPQPCDTCGGCSQQCCLPDAVDAGGDGGCEGSFSCLCGTPVCVDGGWECQGSCSDGG